MTEPYSFDAQGFEAFLQSRAEPAWLTEARTAAWRSFGEQDWPSRREEEWIRTDIRLLKLDKFSLPSEDVAAELPEMRLAEGVELAGQSVSYDSRSVLSHIDDRWAQKGVLFGSLDRLLAEHGDRLCEPLTKASFGATYDRFASLHSAFWSGGHLLYVPRGVTVELPFHACAATSDGGVDMGRVLVILEDGAEATLLHETLSPTEEASGLHCGAVDIRLGAGSNLRYVNMQDWGHGVWHFAHQKALVDRDASLQWTIAALGARLAKVNQHVALTGPGAQCQVNGVMFTEGKQQLSYNTLQHHMAPQCRSDFLYKAALQDRSRTVWRGMIKVDKEAQRTDGYQRNDNLLLSEQSRADSIPGLEIEADDVRCTHGSTTGKVDEELIFYARCRGYTRREAVRMIVTGFFQQIFDRITIESVREALMHAIARRVREYD